MSPSELSGVWAIFKRISYSLRFVYCFNVCLLIITNTNYFIIITFKILVGYSPVVGLQCFKHY